MVQTRATRFLMVAAVLAFAVAFVGGTATAQSCGDKADGAKCSSGCGEKAATAREIAHITGVRIEAPPAGGGASKGYRDPTIWASLGQRGRLAAQRK